MKFEKLFLRARQLEVDYVVIGHYARIVCGGGRYLLKKATDATKDQSYVLYSMTQEQLAYTLFPLGEFNKSEVRDIAEKQGFVNAKKRDSQDICFVRDGDYSGIRKDNKNVERYRLDKEQILSCCKQGYELGFRTFVLQCGEDNYYSDKLICEIVSVIKSLYSDCAATLSLGEKSYDSYKAYYNAGIDRYLLRHEK